ncbi:hypothetical protein BGZ83_008362 [Gryganskiella cystojenkinii]|nr:hypothetical protein BGZ83_008362 [Gryganskiella cystojenkinii]
MTTHAHATGGSLRASRSTSTFGSVVSSTQTHDPLPPSRRASSIDSATLLPSGTVTATFSKATMLSASSSLQSSGSFTTSTSPSASSSSLLSDPALVTTSEPQPADARDTDPQPRTTSAESISIVQSMSTTPSNSRRPDSIVKESSTSSSRPVSTSAHRVAAPATTTRPKQQTVPPMDPLFFGDYSFPEHPTVHDLLQVFLLDKSSKQRDFHHSLQLHAHLMGLALSARLSRGLDLAYDHAHDAYKNRQRPERRTEFISCYNYTHEETERILLHALAHPHPRPSFLDMINQSSSFAILAFFHQLRTDPTILATAFRNLQAQELDTLLSPDRATAQAYSHVGNRVARERGYSMQNGPSHSTTGQQSSPLNQSSSQDRQHSTQGSVPNFVNGQDIIHIILCNLFGPSSFEREHNLRTRTIKAIFTGLLTEKKGERLMTDILERYVAQSEWQQCSRVKANFERTLLNIVHRGESTLVGFTDDELNANILPMTNSQFNQPLGRMPSVPIMKTDITDPTTLQQARYGNSYKDNTDRVGAVDSRSRTQSEKSDRQAVVEEFYIEACLDILDALNEFSPPCIFELSRMIFSEIDERTKPYASLIIIVKFFFYRFMNKCIAYPETYGLMQDVFITERQRQSILYTTHQRLYRYVTSILNPVPGWESRSPMIDSRIRDKVDLFIRRFSSDISGINSEPHYTLKSIAELSTPGPMPERLRHDPFKGPTVTPMLLLCPSDFTTLFYFVCPGLRSASAATSSGSGSSMTRSSSFSGKGSHVGTRMRTSSETPPTYPAAMRAATPISASGSGTTSPAKATHPPLAGRTHKRSSPSFPFFAAAAVALPFKSKPPPPLPLEKYPTAPAESSTFLSLSRIKPGQVVSPKTATVEVTSCAGASVVSQPCSTDKTDSTSSTSSTASISSISSIRSAETPAPPPQVTEPWADETLLPDLKTAILELKRFQSAPIKEFPWAQNNPNVPPLKEPWALAYVHYTESDSSDDGEDRMVESGLAMAPSCMAMMMENATSGGPSRIVTVTKPILVDQVMDSAFSHNVNDGVIDLDLNVDESDGESMLSSEDSSFLQHQAYSHSSEDKGISILRVNSSQMLSSTAESGMKSIPHPGEPSEGGGSRCELSNSRSGYTELSAIKRTAADRAWKARIRETVHSEADFPEDVRTVARSIFRVIRDFDIISETPFGDERRLGQGHHSIRSLLLQGVEQARVHGNHAAAIGFHHALRILDSSATLRQLDSSKLIYLLAMPIKHRLEHRLGRSRGRAIWDGYAHTWHQRVVAAIDRKRELLSSLRIKMYYQTCVRNSRAFDRSLRVIRALSQLNREALRKYQPVEEWDRCFGEGVPWEDADPKIGVASKCGHPNCRGNCIADQYSQSFYGDTSGFQIDTASRRYSGNSGPIPVLRASKGRRSSFSTYMDNVTSRSLPYQESTLGLLKERQLANFSSSAASAVGGGGGQGEVAEPPLDFSMDAREVEAVQRWVNDAGIHNFLPGDDVFLRFCMEIESVIRGIGLGGTGIQGAGILQMPSLSGGSGGGDFFAKEVQKYNGQFVPGMGPSDPVPVTKQGSTSGVAEFLANSFKSGGQVSSSVPTVTGNHFFPSGANQSNPQLPNVLSGPNSAASGSGSGNSRMTVRHAFHSHSLGSQEPLPFLAEDPSSVYSFPSGPTYALYHPPYSTTSHGTSSATSGSSAHGGMSSTFSQGAQAPKDMNEFLRRIQLKLTSFVLSEWLDQFGEVEADLWFQEFLEEMCLNAQGEHDRRSRDSCDDEDFVHSSHRMDLEEDPLEFPIGLMSALSSASENRGGLRSSVSLNSMTQLSTSDRPHSGSEMRTPRQSNYRQQETFSESTPRPPSSGKSLLSFQSTQQLPPGSSRSAPSIPAAVFKAPEPYNLSEAYQSTIEQFNHAKSPYQKLSHLFALELLIVASLSYPDSCSSPLLAMPSASTSGDLGGNSDFDQSKGGAEDPMSPRAFTPGTDAIVNEIEKLFRQPQVLRPRNLLRDMQLIATFIPGTILDLRDDGKAFWDMALAISSLKTGVVEYVVRKGSELVEVGGESGQGGDGRDSDGNREDTDKSGSRPIIQDDEERVRMAEAVRLFTIGAKESHPVAQRELGILYMSLPMIPSASSPTIGHLVSDGSSPVLGRTPSPVSGISTTTKFSKSTAPSVRTNTPPPPSPKGVGVFGNTFKGSTTASIPIKQKGRHQHSSSGSGSSFGSGVLSGLGIITGLGSFTSSSIGSGGSEGGGGGGGGGPSNSSAASLLQQQQQQHQQQQQEFAEGHHHHDFEQYLEPTPASRLSAGLFNPQKHSSLQPLTNAQQQGRHHHHHYYHHGHGHHHQHPQHHHRSSVEKVTSGPDKFNPENVAAAMHWFGLAAAQGDKFSINYLKHKETAGGVLGGHM